MRNPFRIFKKQLRQQLGSSITVLTGNVINPPKHEYYLG